MGAPLARADARSGSTCGRKIGANNVGRERLHALIEQYGADTVKAVMKRMMGDAETRLRGKLASLPDGTW